MATIRVRDWTKEQIERIQAAESHSSHDSVIKSLLKDRELARFAGEPVADEAAERDADDPVDTAFEDLTVLDELVAADNGVLFLWCPNCGNEMVHLTVENPVGISVFEIECQRCLTHLDQHAIVAIEIGYPVERKQVSGDLGDDLKACVVDYWDRALDEVTERTVDGDLDVEGLVWQFDQYVRNFGWEWPADVPVVGVEAGRTYRNTRTDERIHVVEAVTENRNALDSYEVVRFGPDDDPADVASTIMDSNAIADLVAGRALVLDPDAPVEPTDGDGAE